MIKKYNEHIEELEYEDEQDSLTGLIIYGSGENESFYILQGEIDDNSQILYDGYIHEGNGLWEHCRMATEKEKKYYIYSNKYPIQIIASGADKDHNIQFQPVYWKDLPENLRKMIW